MSPAAIPLLLDVPPVRPTDARSVLDVLARADVAAVLLRDGAGSPDPAVGGVDPSVLAGRLTALGGPSVVVEASTGHHAPYNLARRVQSLARITGGRAGLLLRPGGIDPLTRASGAVDGPGSFAEYVAVVRALWSSFPAEALVGDAASGTFADVGLLVPPAFEGATYRVAGALNVPAAADEQPVLLVEGARAVPTGAHGVLVGPDDASPEGAARLVVVSARAAGHGPDGLLDAVLAAAEQSGDADALVVRVPASPDSLAPVVDHWLAALHGAGLVTADRDAPLHVTLARKVVHA
ncbi:monooxygenase [Cellulomonas chitinilytica]|uniref:Monooxygenase n=1 Tax=Cellulomonas chitinilytica TaxID=398759 RepID=A0A919P183_9CELL|nr:LLM class flavin-dependent oxidoreductase [Cellulomonas chitinilytica]GIG19978.1 monooxygenase [Cellulomonas chitinilytica]